MTAGRSFWHKGLREWVREEDLPPPPKPRGPIIIGDHIPDANGRDIVCHADGKRYSSRQKYYEAVKRTGGEITGSEAIRPTAPIRERYKPKGVGEDVKRAIAQLRSK